MNRKLSYGKEGREKLKEGIDALANAVKVTLGPKGRNVVISREFGGPLVTKDGVTVAKEIELEDKIQNIGAQMIKNVAGDTADDAGDGTTTATVLAQAIYSEGMKLIQSGSNPIEVKQGMDFACEKIITELKSLAKTYKEDRELLEIATISANNDLSIGKQVSDAFVKAGRNGMVSLEESKSTESYLTFSEGLEIDRGYMSPYFINDSEKDQVKFENCYVLLMNDELSDFMDIYPILEKVIATKKPLLIIAKEVKEMPLKTLIINKVQNNMRICAVKAPGYGEVSRNYLEDIACATGAVVLDKNKNTDFSSVELTHLGQVATVRVTSSKTKLIGVKGNKEDVNARIKDLTMKMEKSPSDFEKQKLRERISKLGGNACTIFVGGNSELEVDEKKDRYEDAMNAVKSAIEEGIIAGGGCSYFYLSNKFRKLKGKSDSETAGIKVVLHAIKEPFKQIIQNAELSYELYVTKLSKLPFGKGVDARTGKIEDMVAKGIIDPVKVVRLALQNAVSIVGTLLTTECIIY